MNDFSLLFIKVLDYEFKKLEKFFELKLLDTFRIWRTIKINTLIYQKLSEKSDMSA